jgi:hypothetical protein
MMALTPVTLAVKDSALPFGNPLAGVIVRFWSQDGTTFVTEGVTDAAGELTLDLEDFTTYWVRFFLVGYSFASKLLIEVDSAESNVFDIIGRDLVEHPSSSVPELCRASGYVVGAHGAPIAGATFSFEATSLPTVVGGRAVVASKVIVRSDSQGYIEVELIRGGAYDAVVVGHEDKTVRLEVPDAPSVDMTDLVWPFTARVVFDPPGPIHMGLADVVEVTPHAILSSGVETPFMMDEDPYQKDHRADKRRAVYYVTLKKDPDDVVSFRMDEMTDKITISALKAGTARIYAELREDVEAVRIPEPVRDFQELIVVVT